MLRRLGRARRGFDIRVGERVREIPARRSFSPRAPPPMSSGMNDEPVRLHVWSDYVCPFCYLELPVLDRLQAEYGTRLSIEWRAFELRPEPVPTLAPDSDYLREVWQHSVFPMAEQRGLVLRLPPLQPRTRLAHEAAAFARDAGGFERLHRALLRAFFEEGRDVGDARVLAELAFGAGLDGDALHEALAEGRYAHDVAR